MHCSPIFDGKNKYWMQGSSLEGKAMSCQPWWNLQLAGDCRSLPELAGARRSLLRLAEGPFDRIRLGQSVM